MTVTHTTAGYTGTVDEVAWAKAMALASSRFRVASSTDWAVSVSGTTSRTINIAAGAAEACGVYDTTTAQDTVAFATNGGGSNRYDALVASFVWGSDTVTFKAITGTTSPPAVNTTTTVNAAKINRIPGVQYDALLAVVQVRPSVGLFTSGDLFDMRPYGGQSGRLVLPNSVYLSIFDGYPGTGVHALDTGQRWTTLNGTTWTWPKDPQGPLGYVERTTQSGPITNAAGWVTIAGLTLTVAVPSTRFVKTTLQCVETSDVAATAVAVRIQNATSTNTEAGPHSIVVANAGEATTVILRESLAAGTYTVNAQLAQLGGTGGAYTTAERAFLLVEDMGG